MKKASIYALTLMLIASIALSVCATVKAQTSVSVYVLDPWNPANGGKGLNSNNHWVGQIPIRITSGSTVFQTISYCMAQDRSISPGSTYTATLDPVSDTAEWRAASYVLTWSNPATNSEAAAAQVALWRLLNDTRGSAYYRPWWLESSLDSAGNTVANQAWGKDVVRQGDQFAWVSPVTGNMSAAQSQAGQTVTFVAQLKSSTGAARPNVQVQFSATLNRPGQSIPLNSTHLSPSIVYTDSQGRATVTVKVPSDLQAGETVAVEASTKSIWPQRYIDVNNLYVQDLIGIGETFQLTLSTNVCLFGFITVLPESPIGTLAAIGAFGGGFAAWVKIKQRRKPIKE